LGHFRPKQRALLRDPLSLDPESRHPVNRTGGAANADDEWKLIHEIRFATQQAREDGGHSNS